MIPFTPQPILFQIGSFKAYTFGLMMAIAALVVFFLVLKKAKTQGIDEKHIYNLLFVMFAFSLFFARFFYFLGNMSDFTSLLDFFAVWNGGFTGFGVITGGILAIYIYTKIAKINFLQILYIVSLYAPLGIAIGRIGCFLRGCCFGLPTNLPWGILYSPGSLAYSIGFITPVHPTQIYHLLANLLIFAILLRVDKKLGDKGKGVKLSNKVKKDVKKDKSIKALINFNYLTIITLFLMLASIERFAIDFLRFYPQSSHVGGLVYTQIGYACLFVVSLSLFLILRKKYKS